MGAAARTAMAIAVVPFGPEAQIEDGLFQMMAGAVAVLQDSGCALVGGHSTEGDDFALGAPAFTVFVNLFRVEALVMAAHIQLFQYRLFIKYIDLTHPTLVLSAGFAVTGEVAEEALLRKSGAQPGQALVLTKARHFSLFYIIFILIYHFI